MKLKSDKSLVGFISSVSPSVRVGVILLLGLLFIFLSGLGGEKTANIVSEEERVAEMCSLIDGVGECRVMMTYKGEGDDSEVFAALVLCEGGESVLVRERITDLFMSLYGIGSHRIEIQRLVNER